MIYIIYIYLFFVLTRVQDWVPGLIGFPSALIFIPLGLIAGYSQYKEAPEKFKTPQATLLIFFLAHILLATTVNEGFATGWEQFVEFVKRVLVFFMTVWIIKDADQFRKALNFFLILALFLVYQSALQMYTGESWGGQTVFPGYEGTRVRWYGLWDGPNVLGIVFVLAGCIVFERLLKHQGLISRLINASVFVALLLGIYLTNSRGAVLALGVAIIFALRRYVTNIKVAVMSTVGAFAVLALLPSRLSEVNSEEASAHERTWLWESGLRMARENPLFGIGRGEFQNNNSLYLIAHNNFVQELGELGYPGFFILIGLLWFSFKGNYLASSAKYSVSDETIMNNRIMNMMLVSFCAVTFFVLMEHDPMFFILGMSASAYLIARREDPTIPALTFSMFDIMMIFGGMFVVYVMIWLAAVKEII